MARTFKIIDDCNCPPCTKDRVAKGGMESEWPLQLFVCLLVVFAAIALTLHSVSTFGEFGILPLPVGFVVIVRAVQWVYRCMRYSPRWRAVGMWPCYGLLAFTWLCLSVEAGLAAHKSLIASEESSLAAEKERYERVMQRYQQRPAWFRQIAKEPRPLPVLDRTAIDVISLLIVLACLASPFVAYVLLIWEPSNEKMPAKEETT